MEEYLAEKRAEILHATDTAHLDVAAEVIAEEERALGEGPLARRRRLMFRADRRDIDHERTRSARKRRIFHELLADAEDAEDQRRAIESRRAFKRAKAAEHVVMPEVELTVRDVLPFQGASASATPLNDRCVNCEATMRRSTLSQLVCPGCGFTKCYIDSSNPSSGSVGSFVRRGRASDDDAGTPKQLLHFLTFLAASQGKTTRVFDRALWDRLCFYLYVQGCRKPEDITKDLVNKAQRFDGGATEHTRSILYTVQLKGHAVRYPADVIHKVTLMFRKLWPAYFVNKELLYRDRSNTQAYKFIGRMCFRHLGLPFLSDTIEPFKMEETILMHSLFTRTIFRKDLRWKWEDGRVTEEGITDAMIDRYEKAKAEKARAADP